MKKEKIGLLIMAYGTPYQEEDIEPYYTHIRHGRKPSPEALEDLKSRYRAIGGISPLARITEEQAIAIKDNLNRMQNDYEFDLFIGLKHIHPFIEDAVASMSERGITRAVSLVLAPHYSTFSIKSYNERAQKIAKENNIKLISVEDWYDEPGFIQYWSNNIKKTYAEMTETERDNSVLIVSAHSLPESILQQNDPYPEQLATTAKLIAEQAEISNYVVGWQSEGNTPEPWIGPDVQDLTRQLYEDRGFRTFVYAPVGFVSDHLEVLYDNDYECKVVCDEIGATYYRPEMPNTSPLFIETLANVIMRKAPLLN